MRRADPAAALRHLLLFLHARGWRLVKEGLRTNDYQPPSELQLSAEFRLSVPRDATAPDASRLIAGVETTLTELYADSAEQLESVITAADSVMSLQVADDRTTSGSIALGRFEGMLRELKSMVVHAAAFVVDDDPVIDKIPPEAFTFLSGCRFLQTARGSFVANVQLPSSQTLRVATLLNPEPIQSAEVAKRIVRILDHIVHSVLHPSADLFSSTHVQEHADVLNLNILEDIKGLFKEAGDTSLTFTFHSIDDSVAVASERLTPERLQNLTRYVRFVREVLTEDIPVNVEGKVVELRSRNPQGNRNYVLIQADYDHRPTLFALTLDNELYGVAVHAHRANRPVRVRGVARRMKTQLKVSSLVELSAL